MHLISYYIKVIGSNPFCLETEKMIKLPGIPEDCGLFTVSGFGNRHPHRGAHRDCIPGDLQTGRMNGAVP